MQPRSERRVHGAEFKALVLAECQQPGASVAAVALAHGLNVNLLCKWLVGRGIKRTGLAAPRAVTRKQAGTDDVSTSSLQFIPVEIAPASAAAAATVGSRRMSAGNGAGSLGVCADAAGSGSAMNFNCAPASPPAAAAAPRALFMPRPSEHPAIPS